MSLKENAVKGGLWFAGFSAFSQSISWVATIAVANLLNPEDYGLMTMASFLTTYVEYLSEMGIAAAIIQRDKINQNELSSLFWLSIGVGVLCSLLALSLVYPTAMIFNEKRIVPVTSIVSVLFVIGSIGSVPASLLRRSFKFKVVGLADMIAAIVSCSCQLVFASKGFGVYTLILGIAILRLTKTVLIFIFAKWLPSFHFSFKDVRPYLRFGINLAGGAAMYRLYESLDKFIIGKLFNAKLLGNYGFALNLASLPVDKIWPIFQQVTFPLLSRIQNDIVDRNKTLLESLKYCTYLVFPLLLSGFFMGEDIVIGLLGEKWAAIIFIFRIMCLVKMIDLLSEFCNILYISEGKSKVILKFNLLRLIIMPISIFIAAKFGFRYVIVPWATIYPIICLTWLSYTLAVNKVNVFDFLRSLEKPLMLSFIFIGSFFLSKQGLSFSLEYFPNTRIFIMATISVAVLISVVYLSFFDKEMIKNIVKFRKGA